MISIILRGVFPALTFTGLITFFLKPNISVIYSITLLIKPALKCVTVKDFTSKNAITKAGLCYNCVIFPLQC